MKVWMTCEDSVPAQPALWPRFPEVIYNFYWLLRYFALQMRASFQNTIHPLWKIERVIKYLVNEKFALLNQELELHTESFDRLQSS